MKFLIEIEVTEKSIWLDSSSGLLDALKARSLEARAKLFQEILWRRIENKEPLVKVGEITEVK